MTSSTTTPAQTVVPVTPTVSADFDRGARAGAEAMRLYFVNEDDASIYDVSTNELDGFAEGAVADALADEATRIKRDDS